MNVSYKTTTFLGLLSVLLVAFPAATATLSRQLADCTEDDFLVTEFVITEDDTSTTKADYEGCYEAAGVNDDDEELTFYKIDGSLTAAGGAFYAGDNFGGYNEPKWFFDEVAAGTSAGNATSSFLCFDLDLNSAADTHPADVTTWGISRDEDDDVSRECEITIQCGCSAAATATATPTSAPAVEDVDEEGTNAAFGLTTGGTYVAMALSSVGLAVANWL